MFATPNEPLTDHVDTKLKKKIAKGQFRRDTAQSSAQVFSLENGALKLKDGDEKKVRSFGIWLDCFIVYMTIRGKKYPDEMLGMLKHMETIKRLNSEGFDAIAYDIRFRHMKATYGGLPWGQFMPESISVASRLPMRSNFNPSTAPINRGICNFFNLNGCNKRDRCTFKHICSKCNVFGHGANSCKK